MPLQTPQPLTTKRQGDAWIGQLLDQFDPIHLDQLDRVRLLDRTETKFVMREAELASTLKAVADRYRVLSVDGRRLQHYRTLYFDTPELDLFRRHHSGGLNRYKVRSREYVGSRLAFLEVKFKTNRRRTVKSRLRTDAMVTALDAGTDAFLERHSPYIGRQLTTQLWNSFCRVTLVNKDAPERLTLDLGLLLSDGRVTADLGGIAIAEVKQARYSPTSPIFRQMLAQRLQPTGFSKYCHGVSLLCPAVKSNRFKPRLLMVERLLAGGGDHGTIH